MSEVEQRLTNELSKLAEQYAEEQKRLAAQVERLEEQVRELAGHYEQLGKQFATWANLTNLLAEDHHKMGAHVTKLTDAYDTLTADLHELLS